MIFEQETVVFQILEVLSLDQGNINMYNHNRNFDALSFRYESDTMLKTKKNQVRLFDNSICFVPSAVDYTRESKKDKLIVIHFKTFNYHSNEIECFVPDDYNKYASLFNKILSCWEEKEIAYKHNTAALLNNIFAELYKDNKPLHNYNSKIYPSIKYIKENFLKHDFSLQTAAEKSLMSETYFRKLFKEEFHISPKKYVIDCRIKYAASMIMTGYFTLQEIAPMCGYDDYKHFSVEFKRIMGVSPSKYKYNYSEISR